MVVAVRSPSTCLTNTPVSPLAHLDALKLADAGAVFAELIRAGLQALIEAEASEAIGAGRYQRSADCGTHRNGHRLKKVYTTASDIEVQIPKLRAGSFFPSLLEGRRRIDRALHAVIMEPTYTECRPAASMIWWPRWASRPGCPRRRCQPHCRRR